MRKALVIIVFFVFSSHLIGCQFNVNRDTLASLTETEKFYDGSVTSFTETKLSVNYNELIEKEFYKNIMNASIKLVEVLPDEVPKWRLIIKSDNNDLVFEGMSQLYAKYKNSLYLIECTNEDKNFLNDYLIEIKESWPNDPLQIVRTNEGKIVFSVIALMGDSCEIIYKDINENKSVIANNNNEIFDYLRELLYGRESVNDYTNCGMDYSIKIMYGVYGKPVATFNTYEFKFHSSCGAMTILKNNELIGTVILADEEINVLLGYMLFKEENTYVLNVKNLVDFELLNIKNVYKEGEQVEVKMEYCEDVIYFVHLNGKNIGYLNGHNSVYFNMPAQDSELIISNENEILEDLTFKDLFGYSIDSATKIIVDEGPGSIAPPWMHHVYEVIDSKEIETFLENLNNITLEKTIAMPGIGTRELTIFINNQEYNISFTNRDEVWCNGNLYKFNSALPKLNGELIYQYYEGVSEGTISIFGEEHNLPHNYFKDIRFLPYSPKVNLTFATKFGIINFDGLSFMLTSEDTFMDINGGTYIIVGNKNFSDLLDGVNIETVRVQVQVSESNSYTIIVSKDTEYSLEELKRVLPLYDPYTLLMENGSQFKSMLITDNITLFFSR